jgi:hypothetical protein
MGFSTLVKMVAKATIIESRSGKIEPKMIEVYSHFSFGNSLENPKPTIA